MSRSTPNENEVVPLPSSRRSESASRIGRLPTLSRNSASGASIRRARTTDAGEMARLAAELGYPMPAEEMARRLALLVPNEHHLIVVAVAGDALRGWAHVEHRFSLEGGDRSELMGLVVDSNARRRGLGRELIAVAEAWTRALGLQSLTVRSNIARKQSQPFYEALGYSRSKTQHVYSKALPPDRA